MSEQLTTNIGVSFTATLQNATSLAGVVGTVNNPGLLSAVLLPGNTAADVADQLFIQQVTLAAGASETLVLSNMSAAVDLMGNTYSVTRVKAMILQSLGNTGCYAVTAVSAPVAGGTSYISGDVGATLTVVGGTGTAATLKILTVVGGAVTGVQVLTPGSYTVAPTNPVSVTGATGSGATFNLTTAAVSAANAVYTEADYLTVGGASSHAWTNAFSGNLILKSGTANLPGTIILTDGGATGWLVASGSNDQLKCLNSGSNPVTFLLIVVGATL